jgi:hypothetical protein
MFEYIVPLTNSDLLLIRRCWRFGRHLIEGELWDIIRVLCQANYWDEFHAAPKYFIRPYDFIANWSYKRFRWLSLKYVLSMEHRLVLQGKIAVLPPLLAPQAYGYEDEVDVSPLIGAFVDKHPEVTEFKVTTHGICEAQLRGEKLIFMAPGIAVALVTVVNFYADLIEHGVQGLFWPSLLSIKDSRRAGRVARCLTEAFHQAYRRNDEKAILAARDAREFVQRAAKAIPWLAEINQKFREARLGNLAKLMGNINIIGSPHLRGDIASI